MTATTDIASLIERLRAESDFWREQPSGDELHDMLTEAADALASLSGKHAEAVAYRWRFDAVEAEGQDWHYAAERPKLTPFGEEHAIIEPLVPASALSTAIRERDEARADIDRLTHEVESAGALRLRMEAHKATAATANARAEKAETCNANLFGIIADIREASGLGAGPMLSELAAAIKSRAEKARADAIEEAAKIADEACLAAVMDPIGPMHGAGRLVAATEIAAAIRSATHKDQS